MNWLTLLLYLAQLLIPTSANYITYKNLGFLEWTNAPLSKKCYSYQKTEETYSGAKSYHCQALGAKLADLSLEPDSFIRNLTGLHWNWQDFWDQKYSEPEVNPNSFTVVTDIISDQLKPFICETKANRVLCGFGKNIEVDCSYCGIGHEQCRGECYWKENAQACIPITMSHIPEAYSVSSDGVAGQRMTDYMGTYVLETFKNECPLNEGILLYKKEENVYLLKDKDGWKIGGADFDHLYYFMYRPTKEISPIVPNDGWLFSYPTANGDVKFTNDSSISVKPFNMGEQSEIEN